MRLGPDVARRRGFLKRLLLRADERAFERRCFCSRVMVCGNLLVTGELRSLHTHADQTVFATAGTRIVIPNLVVNL